MASVYADQHILEDFFSCCFAIVGPVPQSGDSQSTVNMEVVKVLIGV